MRQASHLLTIDGNGSGLTDITAPIVRWIDTLGIRDGLLTVFCRHTSASVIINENAAPAVQRDLERYSRGSRRRTIMPISMTTRVPTICRRTCGPH